MLLWKFIGNFVIIDRKYIIHTIVAVFLVKSYKLVFGFEVIENEKRKDSLYDRESIC